MSRSTSLAATQVGQRKNAGSNLDKQQFNTEGTFPQDCRQPNPCIGKLPWKPSLARNLKLRLMKYSWFIQHRQTQADCFAACQGSTRLEEALAWQERSGRWFSGSERDLQHASPPGTNHMFSYVFFTVSVEPFRIYIVVWVPARVPGRTWNAYVFGENHVLQGATLKTVFFNVLFVMLRHTCQSSGCGRTLFTVAAYNPNTKNKYQYLFWRSSSPS